MPLSSFGGIPPRAVQSMYYKTKENSNGEEYVVDSVQKGAQIAKLEDKHNRGLISEHEYNVQMQAIQTAPTTVHTEKGSSNPIKSSLVTSDNESVFKTRNRYADLLKKLESAHNNGDISDFEYRANTYLLNLPDSGSTGSGTLNIMA